MWFNHEGKCYQVKVELLNYYLFILFIIIFFFLIIDQNGNSPKSLKSTLIWNFSSLLKKTAFDVLTKILSDLLILFIYVIVEYEF